MGSAGALLVCPSVTSFLEFSFGSLRRRLLPYSGDPSKYSGRGHGMAHSHQHCPPPDSCPLPPTLPAPYKRVAFNSSASLQGRGSCHQTHLHHVPYLAVTLPQPPKSIQMLTANIVTAGHLAERTTSVSLNLKRPHQRPSS